MTLFEKRTNEDGTVEYVEANLSAVELPDDHPVKKELGLVKQESITRRLELKTLRSQVEKLDEEEDPTPAPTPPVVVDPNAIVEQVVATLSQRQTEAQAAVSTRNSAIEQIMKDTGLGSDFRPTIEAIPDLTAAKAEATRLAGLTKRFGDTPSGGNGKRDVGGLQAGINAKLGLPPTT